MPLLPVDYTSRDYQSIKADLLALAPRLMPEWTRQSENDFGVVLLELWAYVGDILNYSIDRAMNEAFLPTATRRSSLLAIAELVGYTPISLTAATVTISLTSNAAVTVAKGTQVATMLAGGGVPTIFEIDADVVFSSATTHTVTATQGKTITGETLATSDGTTHQQFQLANIDVVNNSVRVFVDEGGGPVQWTQVANPAFSGATDKVFGLVLDESNAMFVLFGDNVNGAVPAVGSTITVNYRVADGAAGNVQAHTVTQLVTNTYPAITAVDNAAAATGGVDAESTGSLRVSIPRSLATLQRAVTLADYAALATQVPGVGKAHATASVYTNVTLYVAPVGGGTASSLLKSSVSAFLSDKTLVDVTVTIADPTYNEIDVTATVNVVESYSQASVEAAILAALGSYFSFDDADFAQTVYVSDIYAAIANVPGVLSVSLTKLCVHLGSGIADITNTPDEIPAQGTIVLTMNGGV